MLKRTCETPSVSTSCLVSFLHNWLIICIYFCPFFFFTILQLRIWKNLAFHWGYLSSEAVRDHDSLISLPTLILPVRDSHGRTHVTLPRAESAQRERLQSRETQSWQTMPSVVAWGHSENAHLSDSWHPGRADVLRWFDVAQPPRKIRRSYLAHILPHRARNETYYAAFESLYLHAYPPKFWCSMYMVLCMPHESTRSLLAVVSPTAKLW